MATITIRRVIATLFLGGPAGPDLGFLPGWLWGSIWFFLKLAIFPFIWSGSGRRCPGSATTS